MEEQKLLRHITCDYATDVHIRGNILMICGNIDMSTKSYMVKYEQKRIATHRFWKLSELIDSTLKIEDVSQRIIKTDPNTKSLKRPFIYISPSICNYNFPYS